MKSGWVALAALVAEVVAAALLWGRFPERMPVHWNFSGEADRFGSRWYTVLVGPALLTFVWALLALVSRIDPKVVAQRLQPAEEAPPAGPGSVDAVAALLLGLLGLLHVGLLLSAAGLLASGPRKYALLVALFMVLRGNVLGRVRPNFFVGIRTPWTLSDDQVWRRAHRLSGRLLFGCGLLAAVLAGLLPEGRALGAALALLLTSVAVPAIQSYFWWRGSHRGL